MTPRVKVPSNTQSPQERRGASLPLKRSITLSFDSADARCHLIRAYCKLTYYGHAHYLGDITGHLPHETTLTFE